MTDSTPTVQATPTGSRASNDHVLWWVAFGLLTLGAAVMLGLWN